MESKLLNAEASTLTTRLVLRVVAERGGEQAVERVLERAGLRAERSLLQSRRGRVARAEHDRLLQAAAAELSDPHVGLLLAGAAIRDPGLATRRAAVRAMGSPTAVFGQVAQGSSHLDSATEFRCLHLSPGTADVAWRVPPPLAASRVRCDYIIGMLAQVPVLFDLPPARIDHDVCQVDGAAECRYAISWGERPLRRSWRRGRSVTGGGRHDRATRYEERLRGLQAAAADLVSGASLEMTLDLVAARADRAVHAPGYLLDVRLPDGVRHVRSRGLGSLVLEALGEEKLQPGLQRVTGTEVLAVPVTSAGADFGVLAAVARPGQAFLPEDEELLAAYARHAAAGIEMCRLLNDAREQEETARLLLTVARSLAGRRTVGAVARSVAQAVPLLSGADRGAVAVWEAGGSRVRVAGAAGWPAELAEQLVGHVTTSEESPELREMVKAGAPMLIDRGGSRWAREVLDHFQVQAMGAVPIILDEVLVGIILAHWVDTAAPAVLGEALVERLWGLAGLAGVALHNTRLSTEIQRQTSHDVLTGLPNRHSLETQLASVLEGSEVAAVLYCDVSRLKRINESLGPGAGDELLTHVAKRLTRVVREGDTVARYSGDTFVVLLPGVDEAGARLAAAGVQADIAVPASVAGELLSIDLTIGLAVRDGGSFVAAGKSADAARSLIERAEEDMRAVRAQVRGLPTGSRRSPERLRLETSLRGAVDRDQFRVHFQPQIDLATSEVVGVEALLRWDHPQLGMVPPDTFVPIAEDSGLIHEIGRYVLRSACHTVAEWRRHGLDLEIAVNVSTVQLNSPTFAQQVQEALQTSGLPAHRLNLEMTESQMMSDVAVRNDHLQLLRALGIGVSVDDFGTGYSSLAQLHRLPVTEVKIDREFTARLDGPDGSAFVAGIVGLGRGLGLRVVAEGVETPDQLQALRGMGCHRVQGYLLGRPTDPDSLLPVLLASRAAGSASVSTPSPHSGALQRR